MFSEEINMDDSELGDVDYRTRHAQRCKQLGIKDPVYAMSLKDYVFSQMMAMKTQLGADRFQGLMGTVADYDLENLSDYFDLGIRVAQK